MEPQYVGCNCDSSDTIACGQIATADELGLDDAADVGFSFPDPTKLVSRTLKKIPVASHAMAAAESVLRSGPMQALHGVVRNPIVSTLFAPSAVPANLALSVSKGGVKGGVAAAKEELRNPVRAAAVKAIALVFPPIAPAAVGLEAARRVIDATEKGSPSDKVKAVAQIAATQALAEMGDPGALRGMAFLKQAKTMIPTGPQSTHPRLAVCGAKEEESKGVWLKLYFWTEGTMLHACLYSVGGGEVEISRFSLNLVPLITYVKRMHDRLHAVSGTHVGASFMKATAMAKKLGAAKLAAAAKATSKGLAAKAMCKAQTPSSPVSNTALSLFASAKKGVEVVAQQKKLDGALRNTASAIKKYAAFKGVFGKMAPAAKSAALRMPGVKKTVIDGIGAKIAAAKFIKSGGPAKAKALAAKAALAKRKFAGIANAAKSSDPAKRIQAQKLARVVSISAKAREKVKSAAANARGGTPGIVVGPRGKLIRGRFNRRTPASGEVAQVILTKLGLEKGIYSKVSGARSAAYRANCQKLFRDLRARTGCVGAVPKKKPLPANARAVLRAKIQRMTPAAKAKLMSAVKLAKTRAVVKKVAKKAAIKKAVARLPPAKKAALVKKVKTMRAKKALAPAPAPSMRAPSFTPSGPSSGPSPYVNDPSADDPYGPGGVPAEYADDSTNSREEESTYVEPDSIDEETYVEDEYVDLDEPEELEEELEEAAEELAAEGWM